MTTERFTLKKYTSEDYAILDDGTEIAYASNKSAFTFCELLNELHEEKEYYQIKSGKCEEELLQLRRDNEQLKNDVYDWKASAEDYLKLGKSLKKENEQLKVQLHCDDEEGVCNICKHHYLEKGKTYEKYYISRCKKGHEECSKMDLKYCDDFELKEGDV